jgi:hypothetical protein
MRVSGLFKEKVPSTIPDVENDTSKVYISPNLLRGCLVFSEIPCCHSWLMEWQRTNAFDLA